MSSSQWAEWLAYAAVEPFGQFRSELRHGKLMHLLDRAHFRRTMPATPHDFMHFVESPPVSEPTLEETIAVLDQALGVKHV